MRFLAPCLVLALCLCSSLGFNVNPELMQKLVHDFNKRGPFVGNTPPFENLTTPQIIEAVGYVAEIHHVITEDGYILELHRIPYGIAGPTGPRPVAFLQHGLLSSSADWIMDKPDRALAYLLADAGYDVWMNNMRGNTYSRNHTTLDPDGREFWQFTWDDLGSYDTPAGIDYALQVTGNAQVHYVGFSMGTTGFFVLMSEKPEYGDKIAAAALMGPVAYLAHIEGPLRLMANYSSELDFLLTVLGHGEILPSSALTDYLAENYCAMEDKSAPICYNLLFLICGFDPDNLNEEYLPVALAHTPAGTSVHNVNHYAQLVYIDVFQKYDWGVIGNQNHYGQRTPPVYNLGENTPPIALYWGQNDWLATPDDVARLSSELVNVVVNYRVADDRWNHLDFAWGISAKEQVYDYLMDFLSQY